MGASESKIAVASTAASTPKRDPRPRLINDRVGRLIDPRSPSTEIDRTPIQISGVKSRPSVEVNNECPVPSGDPRSPSVGIARTPVKVTVRSFARRLGMLFSSDTTDAVSSAPPHRPPGCSSLEEEEKEDEEGEEALGDGELGSSEPLLTALPSQTDARNPLGLSPFVHLREVEVETEADLSLDEAEEAKESPLHRRLSMSLITCHEGAVPDQIFAEVHRDCPLSPPPQAEAEPHRDGPDHSYALAPVSPGPVCPAVTPSQPATPTVTEVAVVAGSPGQPEEKIERVVAPEVPAAQESPVQTAAAAALPSADPSPGPAQLQAQTGIRCPTFDTKSPSQLVFKPQWLGKGFGATGGRARGRGGKGGSSSSSPLSLRVGAKNAANENKGQPAKQKQRGKSLAEGRSPLQILKETNSPRDQSAQMKLKVSTPDRPRLERRVLTTAQPERRVLTMLDKENR